MTDTADEENLTVYTAATLRGNPVASNNGLHVDGNQYVTGDLVEDNSSGIPNGNLAIAKVDTTANISDPTKWLNALSAVFKSITPVLTSGTPNITGFLGNLAYRENGSGPGSYIEMLINLSATVDTSSSVATQTLVTGIPYSFSPTVFGDVVGVANSVYYTISPDTTTPEIAGSVRVLDASTLSIDLVHIPISGFRSIWCRAFVLRS